MPTPTEAHQVDMTAIRRRLRERLEAGNGKSYWRSLDELADSDDFRTFLNSEFPSEAETLVGSVDRRRFLQLMGASLALAGVSACTRQPVEKILPYVKAPEEIVPGEPLFFASAYPLAGAAQGVLVESHTGRPTKIEGNPDHPGSLGSSNALAQASILDLYDPDRSQIITRAGEIRTWENFSAELRKVADSHKESKGEGLHILSRSVCSPTLLAEIEQVLNDMPKAAWTVYEPAGHDHEREGVKLAFGDYRRVHYDFSKAKVVLSLESDFLSAGPGSVRYTRDFSAARRVESSHDEMNRLYVVEALPSNTGAMADHRLALKSSHLPVFIQSLAAELGLPVASRSALPTHARWISALARDLRANAGASIVLAGETQDPAVHAACLAINEMLGNLGKTVLFADPTPAPQGSQSKNLAALVSAMKAGSVQTLVILGGNPVYDTPADLGFAEALAKVSFSLHLSLYNNETSELCLWHVPEAHYLEAWGDALAYDGSVSVVQPLIAPLYDSKSSLELLALINDRVGMSGYDLVRDHWRKRYSGPDFESFWKQSIHDGIIDSAAVGISTKAAAPPIPGQRWAAELSKAASKGASGAGRGLELIFRADPHVGDGSFANNGWLQETPKPITKLTWDNAALISPATAESLGLENEDVITLSVDTQSVNAPVWIVPGQAKDTVAVHLGYGRSRAGKIGNGLGFNAYKLRSNDAMWTRTELKLGETGEKYPLACTQHHHSMEGRELVRSATLFEYRDNPGFATGDDHGLDPEASMFPDHPYEGYAWGMTIDLAACTGCNACSVACQAENNIAVVGKEEVAKGREMSWIRIDRYFEGDIDEPSVLHQPVNCQHCERAPCELVCPVNATVHSDEGINEMVYNRCVGTRYCSNNCPYKVRRFNFFLYSDFDTEVSKLQRNPDVTIRSRGVMEKCSYCVQRINLKRIEAKREDRSIRDGELQTACQAACPAQAISFGDINDPESKVAKLKANERNYALLGELGVKPRTTYLAGLKNPNPELAAEDGGSSRAAGGHS